MDDPVDDPIAALFGGARPLLYVLDEHGEPRAEPDTLTWARWLETSPDRVIAHDRDEGPGAPNVFVSTVFLGIDHGFDPGAPLLFETMVFGGGHDCLTRRYTTRAEALRGHQAVCRLVNGSMPKGQ